MEPATVPKKLRLLDAKRAYIEQQLPHIGAMLNDSAVQVIRQTKTIILDNANPTWHG